MNDAVRNQLGAVVVPAHHTTARDAGMRTELLKPEDRHVHSRVIGPPYISTNDNLVTVNEP